MSISSSDIGISKESLGEERDRSMVIREGMEDSPVVSIVLATISHEKRDWSWMVERELVITGQPGLWEKCVEVSSEEVKKGPSFPDKVKEGSVEVGRRTTLSYHFSHYVLNVGHSDEVGSSSSSPSQASLRRVVTDPPGEGFSFDVAMPPETKSTSAEKENYSPNGSLSPDLMSHADDDMSDKLFSKGEHAFESKSAYTHSEDESGKSPSLLIPCGVSTLVIPRISLYFPMYYVVLGQKFIPRAYHMNQSGTTNGFSSDSVIRFNANRFSSETSSSSPCPCTFHSLPLLSGPISRCNVVMWNLKRKLMRRLASSGLYFFHKRTFLKFLVVITFTYDSNFETQMECSIKL
ncbi:hypothetical protein HYC85_028523 [Camellia sinensis]|uniref:Uncharacterized protein n=1 Tax=Camellia sinensis TaxID=4442 RepID=A0A7J7FVJ2_CAMSI|nr:hypothetical protein HYC85_028523 [Camellia sinensis]